MSSAEVQECISKCENYINQFSSNNRADKVCASIHEITRHGSSAAHELSALNRRSGQLECFLILTCLAWYDGQCSVSQNKILTALAEKWKVEKSVAAELEDTARTLYDIDTYRSFLRNTKNESYGFVESSLKELEKNQKEIIGNAFEIINV
jgi:hypothetical protein